MNGSVLTLSGVFSCCFNVYMPAWLSGSCKNHYQKCTTPFLMDMVSSQHVSVVVDSAINRETNMLPISSTVLPLEVNFAAS